MGGKKTKQKHHKLQTTATLKKMTEDKRRVEAGMPHLPRWVWKTGDQPERIGVKCEKNRTNGTEKKRKIFRDSKGKFINDK